MELKKRLQEEHQNLKGYIVTAVFQKITPATLVESNLNIAQISMVLSSIWLQKLSHSQVSEVLEYSHLLLSFVYGLMLFNVQYVCTIRQIVRIVSTVSSDNNCVTFYQQIICISITTCTWFRHTQCVSRWNKVAELKRKRHITLLLEPTFKGILPVYWMP